MSTLNFPLNYTYNVTVYDTVTTIPDGLQSVQKFYQYGGKYIAPLFDTSKVTNMSNMFAGCESLQALDISSFYTTSLTDASFMFADCTKLKIIYAKKNASFENVAYTNGLFYNCKSLVGGNGTAYNSSVSDKTFAYIDTSTQKGYFTKKA